LSFIGKRPKNELPRRKLRSINRNIYNPPKGRAIKPLHASGAYNRDQPIYCIKSIG